MSVRGREGIVISVAMVVSNPHDAERAQTEVVPGLCEAKAFEYLIHLHSFSVFPGTHSFRSSHLARQILQGMFSCLVTVGLPTTLPFLPRYCGRRDSIHLTLPRLEREVLLNIYDKDI